MAKLEVEVVKKEAKEEENYSISDVKTQIVKQEKD